MNFTELIKQKEAQQFRGCPIPLQRGGKSSEAEGREGVREMRSWDRSAEKQQRVGQGC